MRTVLTYLVAFSLLIVEARATDLFRDPMAIKTAAFCLGVTQRTALIIRMSAQKDVTQAQIDEAAALYEGAGEALLGFVVGNQAAAGVAEQEGLVYMQKGLDHVSALYKNYQSGSDTAPAELEAISKPCLVLGWVLGRNQVERLQAAFDQVTAVAEPLMGD